MSKKPIFCEITIDEKEVVETALKLFSAYKLAGNSVDPISLVTEITKNTAEFSEIYGPRMAYAFDPIIEITEKLIPCALWLHAVATGLKKSLKTADVSNENTQPEKTLH